MTIFYEIENNLYVNLTNKCSCRCTFCVREKADGINDSESLWLDQDVRLEEALEVLGGYDLDKYESVVFCGYGEPLIKLDEVIGIAQAIRAKSKVKIRVNTNGLANLTHQKDVPALLAGWIDSISISLNAPDKVTYSRVCRPRFGEEAYESLLDFAKGCKKHIKEIQLSVVEGTITPSQIEACKQLANQMGIPLRVREQID